MLEGLGRLEPGTVVLLHACCHNPTGVDLEAAQWQQLIELLKERRLLTFIDMAYQGFDKGTDADATAVRLLEASGVEAFVVANSYSKSFSLYGERVGALSMVGADRDEAARLQSKIKQIIRTIYSSPSTHGAALVAGVEKMRVDFGMEQDRARRFALWTLLHMFGAAPDLDVAFKDAADRDAARDFMEMMERAEGE